MCPIAITPPKPITRSTRIGSIVGATVALAVGVMAIGRFLHDPSSATTDSLASAGLAAAADSARPDIGQLRTLSVTRPDDPAVWRELGITALQHAIRTSDPAAYDEARTSLDKASALDGDDMRTSIARGTLLLSFHQFQQAFDLGTALVTAQPGNDEALAILVDASIETGRYDEASTALQQMLDLRPGLTAYTRTSYLRELHGDLPGAIAAMRSAEAAAGTPTDQARVQWFLGDLLANSGSFDAALGAYRTATALDGELIGPQLGTARVLATSNRLTEALAIVRSLAIRSPQPAVTTLLGDLETIAGNETAAGDAYQLAAAGRRLLQAAGASIDIDVVLDAVNRTVVSPSSTTDIAAIVDDATALVAERSTVLTHDALGWALTRAGRPLDALAHVERSLALGTRHSALRLHAALAFDAAGRSERAATELTAAFATPPLDALVLRPEARALATRLGITIPEAWR
ncbi:MAG: tetratricopeptide repeat protein [Acidimicrobiia bacterium]